MVASRCASGIGAATTRSLILTLSAAKAGADSESVNAATSPTPDADRKGVFSIQEYGWDGCWTSFERAHLSDIGSLLLQTVGPGRPVTLGEPRLTTGVPARFANT